MPTQSSAQSGTAKPARGAPGASGKRATLSKAAVRKIIEIEPRVRNPAAAMNLPENPTQGLRVKISSNSKKLCKLLLRSGYKYVCTVEMGFRTADWIVYEYAGRG